LSANVEDGTYNVRKLFSEFQSYTFGEN